MIEQPLEALLHPRLALDVPPTQQEVQRGVSPFADVIQIDTGAQKKLERVFVKVFGGVEDRFTIVGVRARVEQKSRDGQHAALTSDGMQHRNAVTRIARVRIGAGGK